MTHLLINIINPRWSLGFGNKLVLIRFFIIGVTAQDFTLFPAHKVATSEFYSKAMENTIFLEL